MRKQTFHFHQIRTRKGQIINYIYLVVDKRTGYAAVIDPAWNIFKIMEYLKQVNAVLKTVLLTHSHFDHVDLVSTLVEALNPNVYMHHAEIKDYGFYCDNLVAVDDGEKIELGDTCINVLWTPGHTSGSSCFQVPGSLFTGDTLFTEGVGVCIPEYGGNPNQQYNSIQLLKSSIEEHTLIYPAHSFGEKIGLTLAEVKKINIYLNINNEKTFTQFCMRNNKRIIASKGRQLPRFK